MLERVETAPLGTARLAGLLYLVIILCGLWSELAVRSRLLVPGDAEATAANILANEGLFRLGFAADVVMALSDAALAVLLYLILRPAGPALALAAMVFRLLQTAVIAMNLSNHHAALLLATGGMPGMEPLVLHALELQGAIYDLGLIFFGVNSLLVGLLLLRRQGAPNVLGYAIYAAGCVYLAGSTLRFLLPGLMDAFAPAYVICILAELSFALWLLLRGEGRRGPTAHPA